MLFSQVFDFKKVRIIYIKFLFKDSYNKLRDFGYIHFKKNYNISTLLIIFADYEIIISFN